MGRVGVLLIIEDQVVVKWILAMQKVGLNITLAQLKWKWLDSPKLNLCFFEKEYLKTIDGFGWKDDIQNWTFK